MNKTKPGGLANRAKAGDAEENLVIQYPMHLAIWIMRDGTGKLPPLPTRHWRPTSFRSPSRSVGSIVRGFKIGVTNWARANTSVQVVWQRNYYERIIRDDRGLHAVRRYIANNPRKWINQHG